MTNVCIRGVSRRAFGVSIVVWLGMMVDLSGAQQREVAEAGKIPYRQYCAVCHGLDGRGKGEMAKLLKVKPADLTQLSAKHEGFFPFWDVYRVIDGRKEIWGHGPRDMPIWGVVFKQEAGPDRSADLQAYARILEIVYYIESIQRLYAVPEDTRVFTCHDYQPGGRALRYESTIGEERARNIQLNARTIKEECVAFRRQRDATLDLPAFMLPSLQVNIRAGRLPEPERNGIAYLKLPLNVF